MQIILRCVHIQYMYYDHGITRVRGEKEESAAYLSYVNTREDFISFVARSCNTNPDGNYDYSALVMTVLSAKM